VSEPRRQEGGVLEGGGGNFKFEDLRYQRESDGEHGRNSRQRKEGCLRHPGEASLAVTKRWRATALHIWRCRARERESGLQRKTSLF